MAKRGRKPKQHAKRVNYRLVNRESEGGRKLYQTLEELIDEHHEELADARIAIAWNLSWKPDADGRQKLGKLKKSTDLDRELGDFDFVLILQQEFMTNPTVRDEQRRALIDHELCHGAIRVDRDGEPVVDERGRKVYRTRKHDVEEFAAIIERHGIWKRDLERFAAALRRAPQLELFTEGEQAAPEGVTAH